MLGTSFERLRPRARSVVSPRVGDSRLQFHEIRTSRSVRWSGRTLMMIVFRHRLLRLQLVLAALLLAAFVGSCCSCKNQHDAPRHARAGGPKHIGRLEVPADAIPNTNYDPK